MKDRWANSCFLQTTKLASFVLLTGLLCAGQVSVTTYHYDNYRTGWNKSESTLTPAKVGSTYFGLLKTITLDEQVDAQPLVVPGVSITAGSYQGIHDVVYVVTENNTAYAIDVHSGTILLSNHLGAPVSKSTLIDGCGNNGPNLGITSTPVIDLTNKLLYVMAYLYGPKYGLYGLDLGSLTAKVSVNPVSATHTLTDGSTFTFNPSFQRQRPALLLANGYLYAGFGSFCDYETNLSRGWMLGWAQGTLAPLPHNQLMDTQASDYTNYFLSSIWMSGYGPAADDSGNVLYVTGNSDKNADTYDGITDIQESVVKAKFDLSTVIDHFTPSNQWSLLDQHDDDFGAGGVLVLPDQSGSHPHLAVAAGKDGNMYLMNEDNLGGFSTTNNVFGTYAIGACWCGESYYIDPSDGLGRVVSSGAGGLELWKLQTGTSPSLTSVGQYSNGGGALQFPGYFTSISSNGNTGPVIWDILRPSNSSSPTVTLQAFDPEQGLLLLFNASAGSWPNTGGNANLVPVVANGQVFVASNKQLQIFGLMSVANPPQLSNTVTQTPWSVPPYCQGTHYSYSNWTYRDTNGLHFFVGTSDAYRGNAQCNDYNDGFTAHSTDGEGYLLVANGGSGTITPP